MGGPYSAKEAAENGLITGISYRQYVLDSVLEAEHGGSEDNKLMVGAHLLCMEGIHRPMRSLFRDSTITTG